MHAFITPKAPDLPPSPDTLTITPMESVGIAEVRQVQTFLSRKPLQLPRHTVVIESAHLLTLPAQHALLKTLEEPPGNSLIYLVTRYPDSLLPTILSRVQVVNSPNSPNLPNSPNDTKLIEKLLESGVGDRLALLDSQSFTRDSALAFLDSLEHHLHSHLDLRLDYELIVQTRRYLKANCSVRLAMDHFALSLHTPGV